MLTAVKLSVTDRCIIIQSQPFTQQGGFFNYSLLSDSHSLIRLLYAYTVAAAGKCFRWEVLSDFALLLGIAFVKSILLQAKVWERTFRAGSYISVLWWSTMLLLQRALLSVATFSTAKSRSDVNLAGILSTVGFTGRTLHLPCTDDCIFGNVKKGYSPSPSCERTFRVQTKKGHCLLCCL